MPSYIAILLLAEPAKGFYDKAPVWINLALAIVGVIGIAIAIGTLIYVGQQAKEAKEQRLLSEKTAKQELRSYLCISGVRATFSNTAISMHLEVENGGQTPAYEVRSWGRTLSREYPLESALPRPDDGMPQGTGIIPSKGRHIVKATVANTGVSMGIHIDPKWALYSYGEVSYRDIFGDYHTLEYRLIYGGAAGTDKTPNDKGGTDAALCMDTEGNVEYDHGQQRAWG